MGDLVPFDERRARVLGGIALAGQVYRGYRLAAPYLREAQRMYNQYRSRTYAPYEDNQSRNYGHATQGEMRAAKESILKRGSVSKMGDGYTAKKLYKRRRSKSRRVTINKKIRRVMNAQVYGKPWTQVRLEAYALSSQDDLVAWHIANQPVAQFSNLQGLCSSTDDIIRFWRKPDLVTQSVTPDLTTSTIGELALAKFKINQYLQYEVRNNTNFPCFLTLYVVKCAQQTGVDVITDLNNRFKATHADAADLDYTRDVFQFFSTPGTTENNKRWVIHSKKEFDFQGGQEMRFTVKIPSYIFNPAQDLRNGTSSTNYLKGTYKILYRMRGHVSHDKTTPNLVGISNAQLDFVIKQHLSIAMKKDSMEIAKKSWDARSGFEQLAPIVADKDQVGVGEFELI